VDYFVGQGLLPIEVIGLLKSAEPTGLGSQRGRWEPGWKRDSGAEGKDPLGIDGSSDHDFSVRELIVEPEDSGNIPIDFGKSDW
jgi:hypothetical protein